MRIFKECVSLIVVCCFVFARKKLKSTSKYIYQTLFLNGENSDIKICALGEEWNLHKIYLCQVSGSFLTRSRNGVFNKRMSENCEVWLEIFLFFFCFIFRTFTLSVDANSYPTPVSNIGKQSCSFTFEKCLCFSLLLLNYFV